MQYRTMPKWEDILSVLGYGCMRLPTRIGASESFLGQLGEDEGPATITVAAMIRTLVGGHIGGIFK